MKKSCLLLCFLLILQILCGCTSKKEEFKKPVNFYYCRREVTYNSPQAVLYPETREGYSYHSNIIAYLHAYLCGPQSEELEAPIPPDVYLVSCSVEEGIADIVFSNQFSKLSGVKLATACSALLLSVHEFSNVETIRVRAKDAQVDGRAYFELSLDDIVLLDTVTTQD